jgi:hypothetical protein
MKELFLGEVIKPGRVLSASYFLESWKIKPSWFFRMKRLNQEGFWDILIF